MKITIATIAARDISDYATQLQRIYLESYPLPAEAGPPFIAGLLERAEREGFKLCTARDETAQTLIGLAYGFTRLPGQAWTDAMRAAVGPRLAAEWLDQHFEFAEFGVRHRWQGHGIGARLHEALFGDLLHRRGILTVRTGQQPVRGFYERRGWIALDQAFFGPSGRGPYCIMGLDLAAWKTRS